MGYCFWASFVLFHCQRCDIIFLIIGDIRLVTLVIMDGLGWSEEEYGNAVKQQGTPNLLKLKERFPFTTLVTHGKAVGLEEGQMGGSEVGHLSIGAGRVVFQDLTKINNFIEDDTLKNMPEIKGAFEHAKENGSKLHLMGLLSNGGIHSKIEHLEYLIDKAHEFGLNDICVHAFMDGRDSLKNSGINFINRLEKYVKGKNARISSICGRIYAMDREKRYDRLQKAYDMLVLGKADNYCMSAHEAIEESYKNNIFDEFVEPSIIGKPDKIESDDSVIFFNYRSDRARELSEAICEQDISEMQLVRLQNLYFVGMTQYNENFKNIKTVIKPELVTENLSKIISSHNMKQFHISETTKYAHVTFFFNGGIEKANKGEERKLIESFDVKDFSEVPEMKAIEITNEVLEAIASGKYDFVIANLSNADMIGHTGNFEATKKAVEIVDKCSYLIALATLSVNGHCIITADHGNADVMFDKDGNIVTSHSMNQVPLILASEKFSKEKLKSNLSLTSIAPTILKLLNIEIPSFMDKPLF